MPSQTTKGWYSRSYLPHLDAPGLLQFISSRLADALPRDVLDRIVAETGDNDSERLRRIEKYLDSGHGDCLLRQPDIATIIEDALLFFDGRRYALLAWVIMPNHVHCLIETRVGHPLDQVVQAWKSFSAKASNQRLNRSGSFWQRDYFDRYIRDDEHLAAVQRYIENNPVKAGLCDKAEDWLFGSARRR